MTIFKNRKLKKHMQSLKARTIRDKANIDYIRKKDTLGKSYQDLADEMGISAEEVKRICWDYRDAIENDTHYRIDVLDTINKDY